jgi:hypothetical protein
VLDEIADVHFPLPDRAEKIKPRRGFGAGGEITHVLVCNGYGNSVHDFTP